MVQFDRRFGSTYKGYCRENVKRDTERALDQEFSGRSLRGAIDDRGVASLIFRNVEERVEIAERTARIQATDRVARERASQRVENEPEPVAIELEKLAEDVATPRPGRLRRWLRSLFG